MVSMKFRKFLKEQNLKRDFYASGLNQTKYIERRSLTNSFNRFKTIKRGRRFKAVIDDERLNLIAFKRSNKTYVVDKKTYKPIIRTKNFNTVEIQSEINRLPKTTNVFDVFNAEFKKEKGDKKGFIKKVEISKRKRTFKLLRLRTDLERGNQIYKRQVIEHYSDPLKKGNEGRIRINVTFISNDNDVQTVEGESHGERNLSSETQRNIAYNEAFKGALSSISFYDVKDFTINWVHYTYFVKK